MIATTRARGVFAGLLLLAATVGLPAALAATVGNPLHAWPSLRAGQLTDTDVMAILAAVFYLAWASFLTSVLVELATAIIARVTHRPRREIPLPLLGPQQDLARALLGAVLLLLPAGGGATAVPTAAQPPAAVSLTDIAWPATPSTGTTAPSHAHLDAGRRRDPQPRRYVIPATGGMRSYWALAEHYLGDGARWREIWRLNEGRVHADGTVMDTPRRLDVGWTVLIPPADGHHPDGRANRPAQEVTVRPGDTLSGIAAADGLADWHPVWADNADRREPDHRRFTDPNLILPGWKVRLLDTSAPGQRPASDRNGHSRSGPTNGPTVGLSSRPEHSAAPAPAPTSAPTTAPASMPPSPADTPSPVVSANSPARHGVQQPARNPLPVPLEVGLAALAGLAVLDRARRIAQRRRRRCHRPLPPPPPLRRTESTLRHAARRTQPTVAAVGLAAALTAEAPVTVRAALAYDDGTVDLLVEPPDLPPPPPFVEGPDGWRLPADAAGFTFAVDDTADPCPTLVPVGRDADATVLVNLATTGPVSIVGGQRDVEAYLAGLATALAGAPWAGRVTVHVPPPLAGRTGPADRIVTEPGEAPAGVRPRRPIGDRQAGATAGLDGPSHPSWDTTPIDVYCGWSPANDTAGLVELAADPSTPVHAVLAGHHPGTAIWTLVGDQLAVPGLPQPVTVSLRDEQTAVDVTELVEHTTNAPDVPVGDPRLPDLATDAPPQDRPAALRLNLLGPVELTGIDTPRRSQILNLLAYLALHRRGADHDQIATALWPNQVVTGKTLRNRITEARALVNGAISDGPRWRLDPSVTTDWQQFTALAAGTPDQQHEALRLVRGRPFAGLDDTEWIELEGFRSEVEAAIVDLALEVAERDIAAGDHAAAYAAARAGLAASRYEERLHRLAIQAAQAEGSDVKVRGQQREMRTVLDLDVEPDDQMQPETLAMYEAMNSRRRSAG